MVAGGASQQVEDCSPVNLKCHGEKARSDGEVLEELHLLDGRVRSLRPEGMPDDTRAERE
jgi:hypothetical protein